MELVWFVGDSEPMWDTVPSQWDPPGHTPPANLLLPGVSLKVVMWKLPEQVMGCPSCFTLRTLTPWDNKAPCRGKATIALPTSTHQWGGIATMLVEKKCLYFTPISHLEDGEKRDMGSKSRVSPLAYLIA